MKSRICIYVFLFALFSIINAYGQSVIQPFALGNANVSRVQNIGRVVKTTTQLNVSSWNAPIYGLSVNAQIKQKGSDSFVRIILFDKEGNEYLVAESNRMFNDTSRVAFSDYCEETLSLNGVTPVVIKIVVHNAELYLQSFNVQESLSGVTTLSKTERVELRHAQVEQKVAAINAFNLKHKVPWRAGVTDISLEPFSERKAMMGMTDDESDSGGFEYYKGGIFCNPTAFKNDIKASVANSASSSPYVKEYDWRNRHGKNWMTSVKKQTNWTCWAFASLGTLEAYINIYYNKLLNNDLSEQDLVMNAPHDANYAGYGDSTMIYIRDKGVVTEDCFPYTYPDTTGARCKNPSELVHITSFDELGFNHLTDEIENKVKSELIKAPLMMRLRHLGLGGHLMTLVGYNCLQDGDVINLDPFNTQIDSIKIDKNSPLIGKTMWILKNSYGENWGDAGYCNFVGTSDSVSSVRIYTISGKPFSEKLESIEADFTDNDGDGYYYWGLGLRPKSAPEWIPLFPDGEDADYTKGPMDKYGFCKELCAEDTIFVKNNITWDNHKYLYNHIVIQPDATLTISDTTTVYKGCKMIVQPNAKLVVDSGQLKNVMLHPQKGSSIEISNGGKILFNKEERFTLPLGCNLTINNGMLK